MFKKFVILSLLLGSVNMANAACTGPYCFDDGGAFMGDGFATPALLSRTKAQIAATDPRQAGILFYCSDCTSSLDAVCVSSGTGRAAIVKISSQTVNCGS